MSLLETLNSAVNQWAAEHCPTLPSGRWVQFCQNPQFGHFQTNIAMVAGKSLQRNPREIAQQLAGDFAQRTEFATVEIAGPGFVNFRFSEAALADAFNKLATDPHLGIPQTSPAQTWVFDFSAPNVAKSMHVGHIRSTILGDTLARLFRKLGHHVITDNHIGDWGTQFGKIILGYKESGQPPLDPERAVEQMETWYQTTHQRCEADPALLRKARAELVKLQDGDPENVQIWESFRKASQAEFDEIYQRLGVSFDHTLGESFYNPWLKPLVQELMDRGIARESEEAVCIFFPEDSPLADKPMLIQKSDGASLYATTDLATLRYRVGTWKADGIVYVTDGRQQLHFQQLFAAARMMGLTVLLEHAWFGSVLGPNKKPLKTRDGTPLKLRELLEEGVQRAAALLLEKRPDLPQEKIEHLSHIIGIGSIKYADQLQNRNLDYVFDWNKLLAFDGNTAPYLINAYVRCRSILRKWGSPAPDTVWIGQHPLDWDLARKTLELGDVARLAADELKPHHLCTYLYDLAALFHRFFEECPVGQAETGTLKQARLVLCDRTSQVLKTGLGILGIETVEEM